MKRERPAVSDSSIGSRSRRRISLLCLGEELMHLALQGFARIPAHLLSDDSASMPSLVPPGTSRLEDGCNLIIETCGWWSGPLIDEHQFFSSNRAKDLQ
jgi:hypothetical protein